MKSIVVVARVVFVVAIALAGITLVFCYLAVVSAGEPKCAGHEWGEGYRTGNFLRLSLATIWVVAIVGVMAVRSSKPPRSLSYNVFYNMPVFEFASTQVTLGMVLAYSILLSLLGMLAIGMGMSITHYQAILTVCLGGDS